jgi:hypothetical protein
VVSDITPEQRDLIEEFREAFPFLITVEDTMRFTLRLHSELQAEKQTCLNWVKVAELMMPYVMASPEFEGKFAPAVMTQFTSQAVRGE